MRKLAQDEVVAFRRYATQQLQLRRIERLDLAFRASNALIDRIAHDVGASDDALMARLMTRKAANYQARVHRSALLRFVQKLVALSTKRVRAVKELGL